MSDELTRSFNDAIDYAEGQLKSLIALGGTDPRFKVIMVALDNLRKEGPRAPDAERHLAVIVKLIDTCLAAMETEDNLPVGNISGKYVN